MGVGTGSRAFGTTVAILLLGIQVSCMDERLPCDPIDNLVVEMDADGRCPIGFEDADGDGFGDPTALCFEVACGGVAMAESAGDCVDKPNDVNPFPELTYPGNFEMCDGIENNCDGVWADEFGEQLLPTYGEDYRTYANPQDPEERDQTWALSCARSREQMYLDKTRNPLLQQGQFDAATRTLRVPAGTDLRGDLEFRYLRTRSPNSVDAMVLVWDWPNEVIAADRVVAIFDHELDVTCVASDLDDPGLTHAERLSTCWETRQANIDLTVPEYRPPTADGGLGEEPNSYYLTALVAPSCSATSVASLTAYSHCCGAVCANCFQEELCDPVWGDTNGDVSVVHRVSWDGYHEQALDAANLTESDLASCVRFGSAVVPQLQAGTLGIDPEAERCQVSPTDPDCRSHYTTATVGCAYLKIVVTDPDA